MLLGNTNSFLKWNSPKEKTPKLRAKSLNKACHLWLPRHNNKFGKTITKSNDPYIHNMRKSIIKNNNYDLKTSINVSLNETNKWIY